MPDRLPVDAEPRTRRRAPGPGRATEAEALALVERAARIPDGLAVLERSPLECVAVLLGVPPRTIERVRAALEDPALRAEAALVFARARGRHPVRPPPGGALDAPPRDPEALLRAARGRDGGLALLLDAAPEAAAIVFGVHPDLVDRARAAARAGLAGGAAAS